MILCITPNPAIDRTLILPGLLPGNVHRAETVFAAAGGKGLNVARAVHTLGREVFCMGFAGGHCGRLLSDLAREDGLNSHWTWIDAETRTCTILVTQGGDATVINEPGMPVSSSDWQQLQQDVGEHLSSANLVTISGSLPPHAAAEDFQGLLRLLVDSAKQVWVDTSGTALNTALGYPRICIKVNGNEIGETLGIPVKDLNSGKQALIQLAERGLTTAVITLGSAGALLATEDGRWHAEAPPVHVVSSVGSGDAFLGGLVSALDAGGDWPSSLRDAIAAGTANALIAGGGRFTLEEFQAIREQTKVEAW